MLDDYDSGISDDEETKTEVVESVDQTSNDHENENPDSDPAGDTIDSREIPGWEKVYALAKTMIDTNGLSYEKCANTKRSFFF